MKQLAHFLTSVVLTTCVVMGAHAQLRLQFGKSFSAEGALLEVSQEFKYVSPHSTIAVKMTARGPLPVDTLYLIVKDVNGVAGRYIIKRSKSKLDANGLIRISADGIYRVYVYNPSNRTRPVAYGSVYFTSSDHPTRASLLERQRQMLVEKGVIRDKNATATTGQVQNTPTAPNLVASTDNTVVVSAQPPDPEMEAELADLYDLNDEDLATIDEPEDSEEPPVAAIKAAVDQEADDDLSLSDEEVGNPEDFTSYEELEDDLGIDIDDF